MTNDPSREGQGQRPAQRPGAADPSGHGNPLALPAPDWPNAAGSPPPDAAATHDFGSGIAGAPGPAGRPGDQVLADHRYPPEHGHAPGYSARYADDAGPSGFSAAEFAASDRRELAPSDFAQPGPAGYPADYPAAQHPGTEPPYAPAATGAPHWTDDPHRTGSHRVEAREPSQPAYGKPYSGQPYPAHSLLPEPGGRFPSPPQFDATGQHQAMDLAPAREYTGAHQVRRPAEPGGEQYGQAAEHRQRPRNTTSAYPSYRTGEYPVQQQAQAQPYDQQRPYEQPSYEHRQPYEQQPPQHTGAHPASPSATGAAPPEAAGQALPRALESAPGSAPDAAQQQLAQYAGPSTGSFPVQQTGEHPARPLTAFTGGPGTSSDPSVTTFLPPVTSGGPGAEKTGMYPTISVDDYQPEYPAEFEAAEERLGAVRGGDDPPPAARPVPQAAVPAADERPIPVRRPRPKRRRRLAVTAIAALALVSGAAATTLYLVKPHALKNSPLAAPQTAAGPGGAGPANGIAEAPLRGGSKLASRATDPEPLKAIELSAASYTGLAGDYTRTGEDSSADCGTAADPAVARTLRDLGCTQTVSVTAVNADKGCVVTFGALNLPDQPSAGKLVDAMRDGKIGSFIPRRHNKPAEGSAGGPESTWWFLMAPHGHWVAFATSAYASGTTITGRDPALVDCDTDMVRAVQHRLDARG